MLRRLLLLSCLLAGLLSAQTADVKLKVRVALYDRDLNLKPVPRLVVKLTPASPSTASPISLQTSLDGIVESTIPSGKYRVTTDVPAELFNNSYRWDFEADVSRPENLLELSNDNAKISPLAAGREAHIDELATQYKRVKDTVVTVWTENRAFDGILIDPGGLVLTVQHQLDPPGWLAVQLDDQRKFAAVVIASDKDSDVAVLRFNPAFAGPVSAAQLSPDPEALVEGERVFTIENPDRFRDRKLITGILSKADSQMIVSDVKVSYVGSPLFNSSGSVVGIVQFREEKLQIKPIAIASAVIKEAQAKLASSTPPPARLLPVIPDMELTSASLRAPGHGHWEKEFYESKLGDFTVEFVTPVSSYETRTENYEAAMKEYGKHPNGRTKPSPPDDKFRPVMVIAVFPQTKMPFWENVGKPNNAPVVRRYKTGFAKMTLLCGEHEVEPIWPRHVVEGSSRNWNVIVADESSGGRYLYPPDSITPKCGKVTLRVISTKDADAVLEKVIDDKIVQRLWEDFEAYRNAVNPPPATSSDSTSN
jgi:S1-C subfamily serine protease